MKKLNINWKEIMKNKILQSRLGELLHREEKREIFIIYIDFKQLLTRWKTS